MKLNPAHLAAPLGKHLMIVGGGYWGKGVTLQAALDAAKESGMHTQKHFAIYVCNPDDSVTEHGQFRHNKGACAPRLVGTYQEPA